ncbi:MAG: hypothetical protein AVDCRST_MAG13-847, partial [uncultured Solirubrobacteraceae bacterium]
DPVQHGRALPDRHPHEGGGGGRSRRPDAHERRRAAAARAHPLRRAQPAGAHRARAALGRPAPRAGRHRPDERGPALPDHHRGGRPAPARGQLPVRPPRARADARAAVHGLGARGAGPRTAL